MPQGCSTLISNGSNWVFPRRHFSESIGGALDSEDAHMPLEFLEFLSQITDPRRAQGKKWQLGPVLLATILAILSGATSYRKVHRFIEIHRKHLNGAFGFGWKTAPAYSAIRTILHGLDGADVERVFRTHAVGLSGAEAGEDVESSPVVAIDGKTLRHSFDAFNDRKAAHLLNAFAVDDALILGHCEVDEKSNEIPAAQAMIEALALEGRLFTLDAMHCQKNFPRGPQGERSSARSS
jgi:hypothetical protein